MSAPSPRARTSPVAGLDLSAPRSRLLLALADDELVTGHRSSHWTGVAPSLEEDLAFSTIAQDEINHADVWLQVLTGGDRRDVDAVALGRDVDGYRHAVLCERPPTDFPYTIARHWAYDHADAQRLGALADSSDADVAAVATKLLREERYHLEHAELWLTTLATGGDRARAALRDALGAVLPEALWLFEPLPGEDEVVDAGLLPIPSTDLLQRWLHAVVAACETHDLSSALPEDLEPSFAEPGGRHGVHTSDFTDDVWPEMTALHRAHPGARW